MTKIHLEFTSRNDGQAYMINFDNIEEYLKHSKTFIGFPASVSLYKNYVSIRLKEPIYHIGDFENKSDYYKHELVAIPVNTQAKAEYDERFKDE